MTTTEERNTYARATFWGIILLAIALLLTIKAAVGVTIEPNATYVFNYTNQDNATSSENFYCSMYDCPAQNLTCTDHYLNISLDPGESQTGSEGQCHMNASCTACPSNTTDKCVIDLTAKPGKSYTYNRGSCDVSIEVLDSNETECEDVETITQYIDYSIDRNDDGFTIRIDNRSVYVPAGNLTEFSFNGQQAITCPEHIAITSQAEADEAARLCGKLAPLLVNDWIQPSLTSCRNLTDRYIADVQGADMRTQTVRDELAQAKADQAALTAQVEACEGQRAITQKQYDDEKGQSSIYLVLGIVAAFYAIIITGIASVLGWHIYKGRSA